MGVPSGLRSGFSASATALVLLLASANTMPPPARPEAPRPAQAPALLADLNNDGLSDRVTAARSELRVDLAGFPRMLLPGLRSRVVGMAVVDVDRDGDKDVLALSEHGRLHVWRNDGRGRFAHKRAPRPPPMAIFSANGGASTPSSRRVPRLISVVGTLYALLPERAFVPLAVWAAPSAVTRTRRNPLSLTGSSRAPPLVAL